MSYRGSCLCGDVKYTIDGEPSKISHCHCAMCQKQHGAAFATYVTVPRSVLTYEQGADALTCYRSSPGVQRKFCGRCGANIEWCSDERPDQVAIALATFDSHYAPKVDNIPNIYWESKAHWLGDL